MHPVIVTRCLCRLKRSCYLLPREFCRLRVSVTVALKFIRDLALTENIPLAFCNMALDFGEVIQGASPDPSLIIPVWREAASSSAPNK
jgi:hypothetical protein